MGQRIRILILLLVIPGVGYVLGSSVADWGTNTSQPTPPSALPGSRGRVKVEVLNGGGVAGVAWEATRVLRDRGFDVVSYGNAGTYSEDLSVVMDRVGDLESATSVGDVLGIPLVRSEPDSTLLVDVTVRLGPDWSNPRPMATDDAEPAPWWDLRRLLRGKNEPESDSR